ncbi:RidA family protein [Denitromonas sp.]|uniref:RidA family protein n=1 Tax=Denitromonas sp. TaxID=2734609 RepID=UPI003A84906A
MERKIINPWGWQDALGFVQANRISGHQRLLVCAGQTAMDADGRPVHAGDMRAQVAYVMDNLQTVLDQAGHTLAEVMQLKYYTTDVAAFFDAYDIVTTRLEAAGCRPAATLLGVRELAFPELMIEIEALAIA